MLITLQDIVDIERYAPSVSSTKGVSGLRFEVIPKKRGLGDFHTFLSPNFVRPICDIQFGEDAKNFRCKTF